MNFSCDNCSRKYSIADEKVGDKGVKIRCKHCGHVIAVKPAPAPPPEESTRMVSLEELERGGVAGPRSPAARGPAPRTPASGSGGGKSHSATAPGPSPWEGEATRAVMAPDPNTQWFAMVKGQQIGPFDLRGLSGRVKAGDVGLKTFVWHEGMADWQRAEELPELALIFAGGAPKEESRPPPPKADAVRSIASALQKSAAVSQRPARPEPEVTRRAPLSSVEAGPGEMWTDETATAGPEDAGGAPDRAEERAPVSFDLAEDGSFDMGDAGQDGGPAAGEAADADPGGNGSLGHQLDAAETGELDMAATTAALDQAIAAASAQQAAGTEFEPDAAAPELEAAPAPAPAPAMSSQAAVSVTPGPSRRHGARRNSKGETPAADTSQPAPISSQPLEASDLFSDLDLRRSGEKMRPLDPSELAKGPRERQVAANGASRAEAAAARDAQDEAQGRPEQADASMAPGEGYPDAEAAEAAEEGRARSRKPLALKLALVAALVLTLPVALLFGLAAAGALPEMTRVDEATGQTVTEPMTPQAVASRLMDLVSGRGAATPAPPAPAPGPAPDGAPDKDAPAPGPDPKGEKAPASGAAGADGKLTDGSQGGKAPQDGKKGAAASGEVGQGGGDAKEEAVGGPPNEEINKVVEATQRAFQFCIEQELKKNPGFRGGKVKLVATVGASGEVKKAVIDREDINQSDLGVCLRGKAMRMVFSSFTGDDVDLEIPLILSTAM